MNKIKELMANVNFKIAGVLLIAVFVGYIGGRYMAPEKVKEVIKTVENKESKKNSDTEKNKHKETTTTKKVHPDGTKETVITVVEDTRTDNKTTTETSSTKTQTETTTVTNKSSQTIISAMGGFQEFEFVHPIYGGQISHSLIGPVNVGVWGLSNKTYGLSVGVSF